MHICRLIRCNQIFYPCCSLQQASRLYEILRSDSERLVEAIHRAGGYAVLDVYAECWHVFQQMPIHRAVAAMESAGRFVQRMM